MFHIAGIPFKVFNEIKSALISALASHGQLFEELLVYEEIKKAGNNLGTKAVINLAVRFCAISNLYIFYFQLYNVYGHL